MRQCQFWVGSAFIAWLGHGVFDLLLPFPLRHKRRIAIVANVERNAVDGLML
jgi:hypothetical protein